MKRLSNLKIGEKGTVTTLQGNESVVQRLTALALLPGSVVEVLRVAPLGDPITIKIGRTQLSLRKEDASIVCIED